jgi:hypothetical protein
VLKVHSNGAIIFRLELVKKGVMTLILALTIPHSTMAVAYGLVAMTLIEFIINFAATRRYTTLGWWTMVRSIIPSLLLTAMMGIAVHMIDFYLQNLSYVVMLALQVATGIVVYVVGAWIFRVEAFSEFMCIVKGILKR